MEATIYFFQQLIDYIKFMFTDVINADLINDFMGLVKDNPFEAIFGSAFVGGLTGLMGAAMFFAALVADLFGGF